jgi:hypothetical protein
VAFCPPELLDDLGDVFADLRNWVGVLEKRPGVFYAHGQPFLHFHLLAGARRRADVKGHTNWTQLDLPRPVTATRRRALIRELRIRYGEKTGAESRLRRRSPNYTLQRTGALEARPGR